MTTKSINDFSYFIYFPKNHCKVLRVSSYKSIEELFKETEEDKMKHAVAAALFKAASSILVIIVMLTGVIYATKTLPATNGAILRIGSPDVTIGRSTVIENLGFRRPWFRDLWPFDRQMYSVR
jgi:hypothetical protein